MFWRWPLTSHIYFYSYSLYYGDFKKLQNTIFIYSVDKEKRRQYGSINTILFLKVKVYNLLYKNITIVIRKEEEIEWTRLQQLDYPTRNLKSWKS